MMGGGKRNGKKRTREGKYPVGSDNESGGRVVESTRRDQYS